MKFVFVTHRKWPRYILYCTLYTIYMDHVMLNNLWVPLQKSCFSIQAIYTRNRYIHARCRHNMWVIYFFTIYAFVYTLSIIFNMLPDRRYFQYIPFDWHVKFWEIHSDVDDVRADLFVHVSQVYLQNDSNAFFIGSIMIRKKKIIILTWTDTRLVALW